MQSLKNNKIKNNDNDDNNDNDNNNNKDTEKTYCYMHALKKFV